MHYLVKKDWITKSGHRAVIVLTSPCLPHYCGYVGVKANNSQFEKEYDSIENINIHEGLIYSDRKEDYPVTKSKDIWWFGFDTAHFNDYIDWEAGKELLETEEEKKENKEMKKIMNNHDGSTLRTLEYVYNQCESLSRQLKNIGE